MLTPKRIALFLDGTWNTVVSNTNVWRLKSLCVSSAQQVVYYNQGVGTTRGEYVSGGMFGYGLDQEVIDAYEWLIANFNERDEIYIFGFSRGAYTARSLSGFISKCGMLEPGAPLGVGQLYDRYKSRDPKKRTIRELKRDRDKPPTPYRGFDVEERWMLTYSAAIPIKFLGVWYTVGALGVPFGDIPVLSRANYAFLETDLRINNKYAYHALAIDEHRKSFSPTLWTRDFHPKAPQADYASREIGEVEQRWFCGAHANVGGGYASDLLAQLPLIWMMKKAVLHDLTFKEKVALDGDPALASITDSYGDFLHGAYRVLTLGRGYYRPVGVDPSDLGDGVRRETINESIDASVFERWRKDSTYRPANLLAWARNCNIDPAALTQPVLARDPRISVVDKVVWDASTTTPGQPTPPPPHVL